MGKFVDNRWPTDEYSTFARLMFHGWAERPGAAYPLLHYRWGDDLDHRLIVARNLHRYGTIVSPRLNLVVSEEVKERLVAFPHLAFLEVEHRQVFIEPYSLDEERFSHRLSEEDVMSTFGHDDELAAGLGRWFEVVTPTHQQVAERLTGPRVRWSVTPMLSVPKEFELPPGVLEEFPFFWGHGLWMSDEVYATLVHDLHPDHFSSQDLRPVG